MNFFLRYDDDDLATDGDILKAPEISEQEIPPQAHEDEINGEDKEIGEEKSEEFLELENRARYERNDMVNFDITIDCESRQKNELNNSKYVKITIQK